MKNFKHRFLNLAGKPGDRRWFSIKAAAGADPAEIRIYGDIGRGWDGGGISAEDFVNELDALKLKRGDQLRIRINSRGGDLHDGNTIYNYIATSGINAFGIVDSVAASAASIIAMALHPLQMPENAHLMIHNPWTFITGNADELRRVADALDSMGEGAVINYKARVGDKLSEQEIRDMMDAETWISAKKAVAMGFADEVLPSIKVAASARLDWSGFANVPEDLCAEIESKQDNAARLARARALSDSN